jgi:hypothetical protein
MLAASMGVPLLMPYAACVVIVTLTVRLLRVDVRWHRAFLLALLPLLLLPGPFFSGQRTVATDITASLAPFVPPPGLVVRNPILTDSPAQFLPWGYAVRESIASGRLPLWNRFQGAGAPLLANAQAAPFSPYTLVGLPFSPSKAATLASTLMIFVGALGAAELAAVLGARGPAILVAGTGFGLSAFQVVWALHPHSAVASFLPWILLGVHRAWRALPRGTALLALAVASSATAGFPQLFLVSVAAAVVFAGILAGPKVLTSRNGRAVLIAIGLGGLLGAPALLPFTRLTLLSAEYPLRVAGNRVRPPATPHQAAERLATLVVPDALGRPEDGSYRGPTNYNEDASGASGVLLLGLALGWALTGDSSDETRRPRLALFALLLAGILASSRLAPFDAVLRRLPLIGAASPGRLAVLVGLSVPVLAALAASAPRRDRRALAIGSTVALLLVSVVAATMRPEAADPAARTAFRRASAWAAAFPAGGFALALAPLGPGARAAGLLALAATERLSTMRGYLPSLEPDAIYPCGVACDLLRQTPDGYRVAGLALALGPNQAAVLGLEDIRAYENLTWAPLEETTHLWRRPAFPGATLLDDPNAPLLSFLGVRRLAVPRGLAPAAGWQRLHEGPDGAVDEDVLALPRFFVPASITAALPARHVALLTTWAAGPRAVVAELARDLVPAPARVEVETRGPDSYALRVVAAGPSFLASSQPAYPGWEVWIDGTRVPVVIVNRAFVGFAIPPGEHRVRVVYRDAWLLAGVFVAAAAALALAVLVRRTPTSPG